MSHNDLSENIYRRLLLRPTGISIGDLSHRLDSTEVQIRQSADDLTGRGLVNVLGDFVIPFAWWDLERLHLSLNIPRVSESDFQDYCREIDLLASELRDAFLPVIRPYSNETVIEILLTAGASAALAIIAARIGAFFERVRSNKIPHIELTATKRVLNGTEIVVSMKAASANEIESAFESLITKLARDDNHPYPSANSDSKELSHAVFLSYRRLDSAEIAGRIYDHLTAHFGPKSVFMDIDSVDAGFDFRCLLSEALKQCHSLLVLIGKQWLTIERDGESCLRNPSDFVRQEIEIGLKRGIPVIPVLVGDTAMPGENELPQVIAELAFRQHVRIDPGVDFRNHMSRLIRELSRE